MPIMFCKRKGSESNFWPPLIPKHLQVPCHYAYGSHLCGARYPHGAAKIRRFLYMMQIFLRFLAKIIVEVSKI